MDVDVVMRRVSCEVAVVRGLCAAATCRLGAEVGLLQGGMLR